MLEHNRMFFKDKKRAQEFCNRVKGKFYYRGCETWKTELSYIEYPEGLEEFEYMILWKDPETK